MRPASFVATLNEMIALGLLVFLVIITSSIQAFARPVPNHSQNFTIDSYDLDTIFYAHPGDWEHSPSLAQHLDRFHNSSRSSTRNSGSFASLSFNGTGVWLLGPFGLNHARRRICLDGEDMGIFYANSGASDTPRPFWSADHLEHTVHTVTVVHDDSTETVLSMYAWVIQSNNPHPAFNESYTSAILDTTVSEDSYKTAAKEYRLMKDEEISTGPPNLTTILLSSIIPAIFLFLCIIGALIYRQRQIRPESLEERFIALEVQHSRLRRPLPPYTMDTPGGILSASGGVSWRGDGSIRSPISINDSTRVFGANFSPFDSNTAGNVPESVAIESLTEMVNSREFQGPTIQSLFPPWSLDPNISLPKGDQSGLVVFSRESSPPDSPSRKSVTFRPAFLRTYTSRDSIGGTKRKKTPLSDPQRVPPGWLISPPVLPKSNTGPPFPPSHPSLTFATSYSGLVSGNQSSQSPILNTGLVNTENRGHDSRDSKVQENERTADRHPLPPWNSPVNPPSWGADESIRGFGSDDPVMEFGSNFPPFDWNTTGNVPESAVIEVGPGPDVISREYSRSIGESTGNETSSDIAGPAASNTTIGLIPTNSKPAHQSSDFYAREFLNLLTSQMESEPGNRIDSYYPDQPLHQWGDHHTSVNHTGDSNYSERFPAAMMIPNHLLGNELPTEGGYFSNPAEGTSNDYPSLIYQPQEDTFFPGSQVSVSTSTGNQKQDATFHDSSFDGILRAVGLPPSPGDAGLQANVCTVPSSLDTTLELDALLLPLVDFNSRHPRYDQYGPSCSTTLASTISHDPPVSTLMHHDNSRTAFGSESYFPNNALSELYRLVERSLFVLNNQIEPLISSEEGQLLVGGILHISDCPEAAWRKSDRSVFTLFVDSKTYKCLVCGELKTSLERAIGCVRSHLRHRPFVCPGEAVGCVSCKKRTSPARFFASSYVEDHVKGQTKKYRCPDSECDAMIRRGGMERHWKSIHKGRPFPIETFPEYGKRKKPAAPSTAS